MPKNTVVRPHNGRFLRHRFSPKPKVIASQNSLPKRNHVAKEAVSAARQTKTRQRSERTCKPNDAPKTKPRPCVKTMLHDPVKRQHVFNANQHRKRRIVWRVWCEVVRHSEGNLVRSCHQIRDADHHGVDTKFSPMLGSNRLSVGVRASRAQHACV